MILFTIIFVIMIHDIQMQPTTCIDDVHCSVGLFCDTINHSCRECLSCEDMRRLPALNDNTCVKTADQCGPCVQGLIIDEANWSATCVSPQAKSIRILFSYIFHMCVVAGILLSLFIAHGIWNTHIIKVSIAIPSCNKISSASSDDAKFTKKDPIGFTV